MAGYSGTPLAKKLGIREGHRVAWLGAPATFPALLGELPIGVRVCKSARGAHSLDVIVLFAKAMSDLTKRLPAAADALAHDGGLWIAWPKKASGIVTDVAESSVRSAGLGVGLVDNKVCAIDETWSGLRFVYRLEDRAKRKR
ncbi:MAG TPA: DUF3052 family protein [Polyangiaceae bacterium]|nr:DUF3052 family protein [Polyangiaceae bacterium]